MAPGVLDVCNIPEPRTGLEGKFSLRATAAMGLLGDDTGAISTYTDERVKRPELVRLRDRVSVVADGGLENAVATAVSWVMKPRRTSHIRLRERVTVEVTLPSIPHRYPAASLRSSTRLRR